MVREKNYQKRKAGRKGSERDKLSSRGLKRLIEYIEKERLKKSRDNGLKVK